MAIVLVTAILVIALVLFVTERLPVDLTALGLIVALMVLGILTPAEAIGGFANPAPITIAVLFVVSKGLLRTGALNFVSAKMIKISRGDPKRILFMSLFLVGGFSSFLNNTPVVVLFISIIMAICCEYNLSPSKFLIPISFVSILAGTSTLIGTSTNILVSDLAAQHGMQPIGMFELTLLGAPTAMLGAIFLYYLSPRLLGAHKEPICEVKSDAAHRYISELLIPDGSDLAGGDIRRALRDRFPEIELDQVVRAGAILDPNREAVVAEPGDLILVKASAQELTQLLAAKCAVLTETGDGIASNPYDRRSILVELLVPPNSPRLGQRLRSFTAGLDVDIQIIGIKRHWAHYRADEVRDLRLALGDILLVRAPLDHLDSLRAASGMIVLEDVHQRVVNHNKAPLAMAIFLAMVLATAFGLTDILVSAMVAMLAMLATGCLSLREAYRAVDGRILILIIGTVALGTALAKTGAADLYARGFLVPFQGMSPQVVLSAFILLTSVLSLLLSNNATAVLLVPIAFSTAATLGVDARPFIVGICFGASACYATPIGYQTNLLVYGPGGYRFRDYLALGVPLNIWVWLVASIFIPMLWPLSV